MRASLSIRKFLIAGMVASSLGIAGLGTAGLAMAGQSGAAIGPAGAGAPQMPAGEAFADTYIVPFAAQSSDLTPVAEAVLDAAVAAYPHQQTIYLRIEGAEPRSETETLVALDRLTWVTIYLTARDVPLEALAFEAPAVAETETGRASDNAL